MNLLAYHVRKFAKLMSYGAMLKRAQCVIVAMMQIVIMLQGADFMRVNGREGERVRPMNLDYLFDDEGL